MPAAVAWAVAGALGYTGAAVVIASIAYAATEVAISLIFSYALSKFESALVGKQSQNQQPVPQGFTARGAVYPRSIIYGATRTSGVVVYEYTSGTSNNYLWYVIAIAGHQLNAMSDVYFDNDQITTAHINGSTGQVTGGKYANRAYIWRILGTDAQTVQADLSAARTEWDSNHRGRGVAYLVVRLERDTAIYAAGGPQNFFVSVQGRRLYDPRLDSTNGGSGSQRYTDATTWTYSNNPALAAADYITGGSITYDVATPVTYMGMRESPTRIDWALVANAANICEQTPAIPGSTTQQRYVVAGVLSCNDVHSINLGKIAASMAGQIIPRGGKYRIYAGAYDAPSLTFTDSDLIGGGYEILSPGRTTLYNAVSPTYVDPVRNYQQVNSAINTSSTYETADGERIVKSVDLMMVDNEYRAQRIGALIQAQSRNLVAVTLYFGINGFKLSSWDTFYLTLIEPAWVNKVFRVIDWQFSPDQPGVVITAREESSTAYSDPTAGSYAAPGAATSGANTSDTPSTPSSLSAAPLADAVNFTWSPSTYFQGTATYQLWQYTAATPFSSATKIWEGGSTHYTLPITDSTNPTRYYWVVAIYRGAASPPTPAATAGCPAKALSVTAGFRASCQASYYQYGSAASQTTPNIPVSTTGGTSPFTYAWTRVSGDTSITCSSASSSSPTFTRASMVDQTGYSAIWQCLVTDNASLTSTVTFTPEFFRDISSGH